VFLIDTEICIFALRSSKAILDRFAATPPAAIFVSVITEAELRVGAARAPAAKGAVRELENFLRPLKIAEFTSADAIAYARIRNRLEALGTPIGPLDTLIGAHALSRGYTLVTNNEREFSRIEGLAIENWSRAPS
jgi:tRNA(fMet)-specific endonuclease VapC